MTTCGGPALPAVERETELGRRIEAGVLARAVLEGHRAPPCVCTVEELRALERDGRQAREELVLTNLGLVAMVVAEVARADDSREDLGQAGVLGLLEAVDRFDHQRDNRFAAYALTWIRNLVRRAQVAHGSGFLPPHRVRQVRRARYAQNLLSQQQGREVSLYQAAVAAGVPRQAVVDDFHGGAMTELEDVDIVVLHQDPPYRMARQVTGLLGVLGERQADFCRRRFGFDGDPATLAEIAEAWGWTIARTYRFEQRVMEELRGIVPANWAA